MPELLGVDFTRARQDILPGLDLWEQLSPERTLAEDEGPVITSKDQMQLFEFN